jgi:hypothetical protein
MPSIPTSRELRAVIERQNRERRHIQRPEMAKDSLFSSGGYQTPVNPENAPAGLKNVRACPVAKPSFRGGRFGRAPYQRTPDRERSKLRRQRLAATSPIPPHLGAPLTPCQLAYARLLVDEHLRADDCRLCLDEIAARIGTCSKTIQRAQYRLRDLKLVEVELRPNEGQKHDTNIVRIVSVEWLTWIAMGKIPKRIGGQRCLATANQLFLKKIIDELQRRRDAVDKPIQADPALKTALDRWGSLIKRE